MENQPCDLRQVWSEIESYDGEATKKLEMDGCRIKFYKGAMEIPLIVFSPNRPFQFSHIQMKKFEEILGSLGLELDCVEEGGNYKINRCEDGQYLGRLTQESLKLHAIRIKELGLEAFNSIVNFYLGAVQ